MECWWKFLDKPELARQKIVKSHNLYKKSRRETRKKKRKIWKVLKSDDVNDMHKYQHESRFFLFFRLEVIDVWLDATVCDSLLSSNNSKNKESRKDFRLLSVEKQPASMRQLTN